MDLDALLLSRLQFAFTIAFHIIFPSFTIGLASYLAVLEGLWLATQATRRSRPSTSSGSKIFALSFGMGVVSGVVMSYEIGTNWSVFSAAGRAGDRAAAGLRGADRLLPGGQLPGRDAVRLEEGRAAACTSRPPAGGVRHAGLGLLDHLGQQLDAASRPASPRWPTGALRATDWWQVIFSPTFPTRLRPHGAGRLPDHRPGGRRGLGLAAAEGPGRGRSRASPCAWPSACSPWWRRCSSLVGDAVGQAGRASASRPSSRPSRPSGRPGPTRPSTSSPGPTAPPQGNRWELSIPHARQPDHRRRAPTPRSRA